MMLTVRGPLLAAVLLLASSGLQSSSALPACPHSCTCPSAALLNCSSSGLSLAPRHILDSVSELDLSHNLLSGVTLCQPHRGLRSLWLGNNSIRRLSLCIGGSPGRGHVGGGHGLRPWSGRGCVSWAPTLQLLSVERNQLLQLPEGLNGSESLQVLQLSFNKISTLRPEDLRNLQQLRELHLQHNRITSLNPQMVESLTNLKVLDVSFNMLSSLHPSTYLSLRNIGADVSLSGNTWRCDCNLRSLRRWMVYDSSRGLPPWSVVCASPPVLSGTDLLELEDDDLNCFTTENKPQIHRDVTVHSGSEVLLSCSATDSFWWTPNSPTSEDQAKSGLHISDITEKDAGVYVCVSEDRNVSVYNLHISKRRGATRHARSLSRTSQEIIPQGTLNRMGQERNLRASQSDLALAVCLSIFITFLLAFILGVLARPFIEALWRRVREKRSTPATNTTSTVHESSQYDNQAFCDGDDPEAVPTFRERRVTFSTVEYREDNNVQYYDTLAMGGKESVSDDTVFECEGPEFDKQKERSSAAVADKTHNLDAAKPKERRSSSSSSSDSSGSDKDKVTQKRRRAPTPPKRDTDAVQQRSESSSTAKEVVVPQISINGQSEIPGFSSEPFGEWAPHTNSPHLTEDSPCKGREELFDFSDSNRSTPIRSITPVGSFNKGELIVASTKRRDSSSSNSSSYLSDGEPSHYTVNPDPEEKGGVEQNYTTVTKSTKRNYGHGKPARRPKHSGYSSSSDSDGQSEHPSGTEISGGRDADVKAKHVALKKWQAVNLAVTAHSESSAPAAPSASSDSDSEEKITDLKMQQTEGRVNVGIRFGEDDMPSTNLDDTSSSSSSDGEKRKMGQTGTAAGAFQESQTHSHDAETKWPIIECENIPRIKRRLDVKAPSQLSSNTEKVSQIKKNGQWLGHISNSNQHPETPQTSSGRYLDIKAGSHSSSCSDSEEESSHHTNKHEQKDTYEAKSPDKVSPTIIHGTDTQWPTLDLEHIPRVERRLDIKACSPVSDSSSDSDSEDDTKGNQKTQWPLLDLQHTTGIKRRLDVKTPSPGSASSSSTSSEDETTGHQSRKPGNVDSARPQIQEPPTGSLVQEKNWPSINLNVPSIKRRLDIKAPSFPPGSSSSSESEEETKGHVIKEQEVIHLEKHPTEVSTPQPQTGWPAVDLGQKVGIKRRLDFKVTPSASMHLSGSDRDDGTADHIKQWEQEKTKVASDSSSSSDDEDVNAVNPEAKTQWPLLNLERTAGIKKRLDVKAASPVSDSSSSGDSEDETKGHLKKEPGRADTAEDHTTSHDVDTEWPALNLQNIPQVKRRLDIKKSSPPPDSSSSSDSDDETKGYAKTERPGEVGAVRPPFVETECQAVETKLPSIDLDQIPPLKRRLDIKVSSSHPDSTSSSERRPDIKAGSAVSDSSSDSDSEDDTKVNQKTHWPLLDLQHTAGIKRRLDVKAKQPVSGSSSSASSEDETTGTPGRKPGEVEIAGPQYQEQEVIHMEKYPTEVSRPQPQTHWPAVDLEQKMGIKRRLDFKVTPPASTHLSGSDSEERTADRVKQWEQEKKQDAGAASDSSSSSDDEDGNAVNPDAKTRWPLLDLERTAGIKRRLDVKATSPASDSSSSSDSEEDTTGQTERRPEKADIVGSQTIAYDFNTKWPALDLEHIPPVKRRLDIKAPSYHIEEDKNMGTINVTTGHSERGPGRVDIGGSQTISHDVDTKWPAIDLEHIPDIKRRLDIKAPSSYHIEEDKKKGSIKITSTYSTSSSDEEETSAQLEKYAVIKEDARDETIVDTSASKPEVNTELQSQWATMNLSFSRLRKRPEITSQSKEPPKLPSCPPPGSSPSSSGDDDAEESSRTKQHSQTVPESKRPISTILRAQDGNSGNLVHVVDGLRKDYYTETGTNSATSTGTSIGTANIRRSTDFKISEKPSPLQPLGQPPSSSSSSSSENEDQTTEQTRKQRGTQSSFDNNSGTAPTGGSRELTVPRLARRLDIKAPQTNSPTSSSSEDEKEVIDEKPRDESTPKTYRRTIMKDSSLQSHQPPPYDRLKQRHTVVGNVTTTVQETSLPGVGVKTKSFRSFTEVDLPRELRWTGVGRHLSGISSNRAGSYQQEAPSAPPPQPPPPKSSDSSSSESDENTEQARGKANVTQIRKYSSLNASSDSFSSTFNRPPVRVDSSFGTTNDAGVLGLQDRRERKGLSALKAMSSERQIWETETQKFSPSTSKIDNDRGQQRDITFSYQRSEDRTSSLTRQSKSVVSTSSSSVRERRVADVLYRFPSYRTHAIGDIKTPQESAPPVPETPLPDEAVELTWRSRSTKTL